MNKIGYWHIATDTLIAIIKAQSLNLSKGLKECITRNIWDIPKLQHTEILKLLNYLFIQLCCALYRNEWCFKPPIKKICLWALMMAIKVSVAMCELQIREFS